MEIQDTVHDTPRKKRNLQNWRTQISFSAELPDDICSAFADSICVVKYSADPTSDIRESILEMMHSVGFKDWKQMEELIYCYILLNSPQLHNFIEEAFLSLCPSSEHDLASSFS